MYQSTFTVVPVGAAAVQVAAADPLRRTLILGAGLSSAVTYAPGAPPALGSGLNMAPGSPPLRFDLNHDGAAPVVAWFAVAAGADHVGVGLIVRRGPQDDG